MTQASYGEGENLTLTDADLDSPHGGPRPYAGGSKARAYCPIHGGDNQRSLEVDLTSGRFFCHRCRAWGYMDWAREDYARERGMERDASQRQRRPHRPAPPPPPPPPPVDPVRDDLDELLARFQEALPGSWGQRYLQLRGIPLDVALAHGIGYAAPDAWPGRSWKGGRLVVPHHRPDGLLVNLYGRAVARGEVPKQLKHDHLKGNKGWFHARAVAEGEGPLYVCEAPLDALALVAAGYERTIAIFGTHGWRWEWVPQDVRRIVLATDADEGGEKARERIGGEARMRGIEVAYLDTESYGGEKDAAAAYARGVLKIGAWPDPEPEASRSAQTSEPRGEAWDDAITSALMAQAYDRVLRDAPQDVALPVLDAEEDEIGAAVQAQDMRRYRRAVDAWTATALSFVEALGAGEGGTEHAESGTLIADPQPRLVDAPIEAQSRRGGYE